MTKKILWIVALATLSGGTLLAQDIVGDWQGTLGTGEGFRIVLHITKSDNGSWEAMLYSIDQDPEYGGPEGTPVSSLTLQGSDFKYSVDSIHGSYEGKMSADGTSIAGTWTQNNRPMQLDFHRATKETAHAVQFITVDNNVELEVLDWGGSGRPLVLLAGLGNTAHVFDQFAPKLTSTYHVYGITRRGFGASSAPAPANGNYSADRLGDDVLAVMAALKLNRPVLVGHSIAGEELSSVGSRYPEKVAGLIYLDAGYSYAYYERSRGDLLLDAIELRRKLEQLNPGMAPQDLKQLVRGLLQTSLPQFETDLQNAQKELQAMPSRPAQPQPPGGGIPAATQAILQAIFEGEQKYTNIPVPILAIYACPHNLGSAFKDDPAGLAAAEAHDRALTSALARAFETGLPSAHVVLLPNASHFVFQSNAVDVIREINAFIGSLP